MSCPGRFDRFTVTDVNGIDKLLDILHDEFFAVDEIRFDECAGRLTVPFGRVFHGQHERASGGGVFTAQYTVPVLRCALMISRVKSFELRDTERVNLYDLTSIEYDEPRKRLTFETGIPLELSAEVEELNIEYVEEDFRGKAIIGRGLFWDSGPRFVEW